MILEPDLTAQLISFYIHYLTGLSGTEVKFTRSISQRDDIFLPEVKGDFNEAD